MRTCLPLTQRLPGYGHVNAELKTNVGQEPSISVRITHCWHPSRESSNPSWHIDGAVPAFERQTGPLGACETLGAEIDGSLPTGAFGGSRGRPGDLERAVERRPTGYTPASHDGHALVADPLAPFSPAVRAWFEASFEAPTAGPGRGLGRHRPRRAHAHPRPDGEWQDPGRLPLHPRPPRPAPKPAAAKRPTGSRPGPLHLPAQGPDLRRRAQPARPAHRDRPRGATARRRGPRASRVASRTGDTPAEDRREIARHPPDILITTPESLYLLLTSQAREILRGVEHVIVDEVHAIAGTKRGAHLALSLERLEAPPHPKAPSRRSGSASPPRNARSRRSPASSAASGPTARSRSSTPARASRSSCRSSSRSTT